MEVKGSKILDGDRKDLKEEKAEQEEEEEEQERCKDDKDDKGGGGGENIKFLDEKDLKIDTTENSKPTMKKKDFFRRYQPELCAGELRDPNFWLRSILAFVFHAARKRKIYCLGRGFTCAKRYLQQRGWINLGKGVNNSKVCIKRIDQKSVVQHNLAALKENAKALLRSGGDAVADKRSTFLFLILDFVPNYVWITHRADVRWNCLKPDQVINRFPSVPFTTKNGLNRILGEAKLNKTNYPRCYEINDQQTMERFIEDYKFTACSGLVRWFYDKFLRGDVRLTSSSSFAAPSSFATDAFASSSPFRSSLLLHGGRAYPHSTPATPSPSSSGSSQSALPYTLLVAFSLAHCSQKLGLAGAGALLPAAVAAASGDASDNATNPAGEKKEKEREAAAAAATAQSCGAEPEVEDQAHKRSQQQKQKQLKQQQHLPFDWHTFFQYYHMVVRREHAEITSSSVANLLGGRCQEVLGEIHRRFPQSSSIDGERNAWILKPAHSSRGKGILIRTRLEDILTKDQRKHLVVQKYIERPLLIYECKFDIRQWFVVTSWYPLVVWMNRASYLRFCSQLYSLDSYHESVHLSNNAIQCKYNNQVGRSSRLPVENMWTSGQFRDFLMTQGAGDFWDKMIYPGMREAIIESMQASQSRMNFRLRHRTFELFGADFMVSQDFTPWLIEINASPAIGPSTSVTIRMVPQLLRDILAVTTTGSHCGSSGGGGGGGGGGIKTEHVVRAKDATGSTYNQWIPPVGTLVGQLECVWSAIGAGGVGGGGAGAGGGDGAGGAGGRRGSKDEDKKKVNPEQAKMIDYIDKVMSIPSCVSSVSSKVTMLNKWMNLAVPKSEVGKTGNGGNYNPLVGGGRESKEKAANEGGSKNGGSGRKAGRARKKGGGAKTGPANRKDKSGGHGSALKRRDVYGSNSSLFDCDGGDDDGDLDRADTLLSFRCSSRAVQSAPSSTCLSSASANAAAELGVRRLLGGVPVATDERIFAKYGCNHHL